MTLRIASRRMHRRAPSPKSIRDFLRRMLRVVRFGYGHESGPRWSFVSLSGSQEAIKKISAKIARAAVMGNLDQCDLGQVILGILENL
jgi:hypothetical protein